MKRADNTRVAAAIAAAEPPVADDQRDEPALANAEAAPTRPSESALLARAAADTVPALSEVAVTSRMMEAKAPPANSAFAIVANTPMPATMAIAPAPVAGTSALYAYLRHKVAKF